MEYIEYLQVNDLTNAIYRNVAEPLYNYQIYNSTSGIMMRKWNVPKIVLFIVIYVVKDLQLNQV